MTRLDDFRTTLTDAGHTVIGFATMAAKKAADSRHDLAKNLSDRTELDERLVGVVTPLVASAKTQAHRFVTSMESVAGQIDARIDPLVDSATDRLPAPIAAPVRQVVVELRRVRTDVRTRAHDITDAVFTGSDLAPTASKNSARTTKTAATKTAATKTAATKTASAKRAAGKNTAAKKATTKATTKVATTKKATARTVTAKKAARTRSAA